MLSSPLNPQSAGCDPQSERSARIARSLFAVATFVLLSACPGDAPKVEPIAYGEATCARCQSVIRDPAFAAQLRSSEGRLKLFDDPGCLILSLRDAGAPQHILFHHSGGADKWIAGGEAWFASTPKTKSPQNYGWAAFSDFGEAQDAVSTAGGGEILPFEQLKERLSK
jgi:copper chaperone NosL